MIRALPQISASAVENEPTARPQRHAVGAGLRGAGLWHACRGSIAFLHEADLPDGARAVAFTQGSDWFAVVTADDRILVFDRLTGRLRQEVRLD